ncbi:high frequency lysogenization protein HflD [Pleionea mediterranea]|jgi:high frequency lysogenization protein|uniref:High frequency lysogenization protein HflD homolog n=1 Tax=Pleionea mediterranea TaxID=523701 RepID=A0A316FWV2_9GAMM|nr:high frequency lysogenization protein HflD [Pleionea mediterranea]PWK53284.1 high frequency lysogenization protein [Pleionea mediterranea]
MENVVLALAAISQAIEQVQKIAWKGKMDDADAMPLIKSIFNLEPESIVDLYSGSASLTSGLRLFRAQLQSGNQERNAEYGKYLANILTLQKQFTKQPQVQEVLTSRIEHTRRLLDYDDIMSPSVLSSIADCYSQSISNLPLRIQVQGSPEVLQNKHNQDKIRALLLAAVRAAVLWRQLGGKKRQFLFKRQQLCDVANQLLKQPVY